MTKAEFWARLTGIYPDELRHVLNGERLGDVFGVETHGGPGEDYEQCPLCDAVWLSNPVHGPHCPGGFR